MNDPDVTTAPTTTEAEEAPPEEELCGDVTAQGDPEVEAEEQRAAAEIDEREIADADAVADLDPELEAAPAMTPADFLRPGGGWAGSQAPIERAIRIGLRNKLTVTSRKRPPANATSRSDHNVNQTRSYAADLSNAGSPTPEMDRTARQIAAVLGHPGWTGGYLDVTRGSIRFQLIWRVENHYNHVHVGARRL